MDVFLLLSALCASPGGTPCPLFTGPVQTGVIRSAEIRETSGIVASRRNPGLLWLHNDSGDEPRLFAVRVDGTLAGIYLLEGARAFDWEDIAIGPAPGSPLPHLYVGDIGDNQRVRTDITVYRVPEPRIGPGQAVPRRLTDVERFMLYYPDGPHDAETLMVDPAGGGVFIVTKDRGSTVAQVFRAAFPLHSGTRSPLAEVGRIAWEGTTAAETLATGGDISPDGSEIVIRTYLRAWLWRRREGESVPQALARRPCEVPLAVDVQGEAIGFLADGSGYVTVSEGREVPIYRFDRAARSVPSGTGKSSAVRHVGPARPGC